MKRICLFVLCLALMTTVPSSASIKLYIAGSPVLGQNDSLKNAADTLQADSLWYRASAYAAIKAGTFTDTAWVDSILDTIAVNNNALADQFDLTADQMRTRSRYLVAGVAESFNVPAAGDYMFHIIADDAMFIVIDGEMLVDDSGKVFLYSSLTEAINPARGDSGYPIASDYTATKHLTQGNHTFEVYYYQCRRLSRINLAWKGPGDQAEAAIPSAVFGQRRWYGKLSPYNTLPECIPNGASPFTIHFKIDLQSGYIEGETVKYVWDLFRDGTPDMILEAASAVGELDTTLVLDTNDASINWIWANDSSNYKWCFEYRFWVEMAGRVSDTMGSSCQEICIYGGEYDACDHCLAYGYCDPESKCCQACCDRPGGCPDQCGKECPGAIKGRPIFQPQQASAAKPEILSAYNIRGQKVLDKRNQANKMPGGSLYIVIEKGANGKRTGKRLLAK
jgi:hypothetical protein